MAWWDGTKRPVTSIEAAGAGRPFAISANHQQIKRSPFGTGLFGIPVWRVGVHPQGGGDGGGGCKLWVYTHRVVMMVVVGASCGCTPTGW